MVAEPAPTAFALSNLPIPHRERAKQILANHPEVRALFKRDRRSALWTILLVALQLAIGVGLTVLGAHWWIIIVAAYAVGAFANHALFVLIHDYSHNLVFRTANSNRLGAIFANVAIVFPAAIGFRNYHLLHHSYLGTPGLDADVPTPKEASWVGNSPWRKTVWLGMFWAVQGLLRPTTVRAIRRVDRWVVINAVAMVGAMAPVIWFFGWWPVAYLFASTVFALGVHPVGARWIQEHYMFKDGQETYSYYGPLNKLSFNMGYHNEHHDFPHVSWSRLPAVRAAAPEFYDHLYHHRSWTRLLFHVLFSRDFRLHNRIVRPMPERMKDAAAA
ncbi:fatty acid desaturase [Sphingomonas alba]|uniref:Fatty acid desaturase n=1 Tax=Sphingomonas alba TaxID=2908208 RepID=A0ABT0RMB4_9SPHN|nr:fatty acid desaturase [Sphingomonas alba]